MTNLWAAISFLTLMPVPRGIKLDGNDLSESIVYFPVVGLLIGAVGVLLLMVLCPLFPPFVMSILIVVWLLGVSGALHIDGLSDTADGFLSARPKAEILLIMKDSRVGVMGAVATMIVLALKTAGFYSLPREVLWKALLLAPIAGRCALIFQMVILPSARPDMGLGRLFCGRPSYKVAAATLAALLGTGWLLAHSAGLITCSFVVAATALFCWVCKKKINGATGDTLGALCEIVETVVVVTLSATPIISMVR